MLNKPCMARPSSNAVHLANRRLAAALVLLGLLLQAAAPYLPMPSLAAGNPAAGPGIQAASGWVPICLSQAFEETKSDGPQAPHPADCPACLVMAQATATLVPSVPPLPRPPAIAHTAAEPWQQANSDLAVAAGFSSRAPPAFA